MSIRGCFLDGDNRERAGAWGNTSDKSVRRRPSDVRLVSFRDVPGCWDSGTDFETPFSGRAFSVLRNSLSSFVRSLTVSKHSSSQRTEQPEEARDVPEMDDKGRRDDPLDKVDPLRARLSL